MGNTTVWRRSNSKNAEASASRRVVVTSRELRRRHDGVVDAGGHSVAPAAAGTVVTTVKVVMTRKDAEALAARLDAQRQSARARKDRMTQLKGELRAGGGGGGAVSPASCRDACWRPQLAPIKESTPVV